MNQFQNRNTPGILFHKLYWLIWTPSQIVMGVSSIWDNLGKIESLSTWDIINTSYGIMTCVLMAMYFIGFFSWKKYAWKAVMTQLITNIIFAFVAFGIQYADNYTFAASLVIGTLIRCVPVSIYYNNRKHLFTEEGAEMPQGSLFFGGIPNQRNQRPNQQNPWQNPQNNQWSSQQNTQFTQPHNAENPQPVQPQQTAQDSDVQNTTTATCPFCGKNVKPTSNFCIYCGKKLK